MVHFNEYDQTSKRRSQLVDEIDSLFTTSIVKREFDISPPHWSVNQDAEGGLQLMRNASKQAAFTVDGEALDKNTKSVLLDEFMARLKGWVDNINQHDIYTNDHRKHYAVAEKSPEIILDYFTDGDVSPFIERDEYEDFVVDIDDENFGDVVNINKLGKYVRDGILREVQGYWEPQSTFL